ncbi:MAG: ATP-binding protein, partial [Streptococcaceae bacterium]|nr:ATP-binding protein [Streptococcaceae bacterium]
EIQEVDEWQLVVNSLRLDFNSDIYLTGSNASILSGELSTYLAGRYVEIKVYPLSFQEFLDFKGDATFKNVQTYYHEYRKFGSFPSVVLQSDEKIKVDVLSGILDSILIRDVSLRDQKIDVPLLIKLTKYLFDIIGQIFSSKKVLGILKNEQLSSSFVTINNYLSWLIRSFLFYKAERYDIRGKERLRTRGKYYTIDLGLRNQTLQDSEQNRGSQLENMVYLELLRRGYQVFVGKYDAKEIDFVARKRDEVIYFQVTAEIPRKSTRETDNLLYLPTGYAKKIIVENYNDVGTIEGIPVVHILDFLLEGYEGKENLI